MSADAAARADAWRRLIVALLPFADVATKELPLARLARLSLFQVSVGMAAVLLTGTLNRVMIVEFGAPAWIVSTVVALPLVFAPLRALIGFRSDHHRSHLGWRRGPFIWFGTLLQFGGLSIMPFALILLSGEANAPSYAGAIGAALAFLLAGAGLHTTQTAGLALATDLASEENRPRVVALLYVALLAGMLISALVFGALLSDFSPLRLIQVIQAAALATIVLNLAALWRQEARDVARTRPGAPAPDFAVEIRKLLEARDARRLLAAVALGAAAFGMQDVLLEPYGGQALGLGVGATTTLTALWAAGALGGFAFSANRLSAGAEPHRLAGFGALAGAVAFAAIMLAAPLQSVALLGIGAVGVGFGGGLFSVGTLISAMNLAEGDRAGLALGAWGATQATAAGLAIAVGGAARDLLSNLAVRGGLTTAPDAGGAVIGYQLVFQLEILLLFAAMAAIGPLARHSAPREDAHKFGLPEFPT